MYFVHSLFKTKTTCHAVRIRNRIGQESPQPSFVFLQTGWYQLTVFGLLFSQNWQISKNILRICRNQLQRVVKRKFCFKIWKYLPIFHVSWVNNILLLAGQVNYIKLKIIFIHSEVHRSSNSQLSNSASHSLISHYVRARSALSAMSLDHVNHNHFLSWKMEEHKRQGRPYPHV